MAAHIKKDLYPATVIGSSTTTVSDAQVINVHAKELIAVSTVSARTDGTFTTTLQHSPDGLVWFDLGAAAAQSANGSVIASIASTVSVFPYVRASIVSGSVTTGATVDVDLYFGVQR